MQLYLVESGSSFGCNSKAPGYGLTPGVVHINVCINDNSALLPGWAQVFCIPGISFAPAATQQARQGAELPCRSSRKKSQRVEMSTWNFFVIYIYFFFNLLGFSRGPAPICFCHHCHSAPWGCPSPWASAETLAWGSATVTSGCLGWFCMDPQCVVPQLCRKADRLRLE